MQADDDLTSIYAVMILWLTILLSNCEKMMYFLIGYDHIPHLLIRHSSVAESI